MNAKDWERLNWIKRMYGDFTEHAFMIKKVEDTQAENSQLHIEIDRLQKTASSYYGEAVKGWSKFRKEERRLILFHEALVHIRQAFEVANKLLEENDDNTIQG